jgi:hypothetical protein
MRHVVALIAFVGFYGLCSQMNRDTATGSVRRVGVAAMKGEAVMKTDAPRRHESGHFLPRLTVGYVDPVSQRLLVTGKEVSLIEKPPPV